ncbi:MAG TPA: thioredoxin domain-containing protein, partial [Kofleriaceae bacterium]
MRVVFKNLVVHPQQVMTAHKAGCAAAKQQKFIPFKNAFWEKGYGAYTASRDASKLGEENIMAMARDVGLDTAKLKADMDSPDCQQQIERDMQELQKFHVNATPTFFINGKHVGGALPKEQFKAIIDERLKVAEASGVSGGDYYEKEIIGKGEKQFRSVV